ncbi:hypothetical protein IF188_16640 [Microbacterium sp. NEAU-LLC]|uniref:Uncharacterized protein n=1 Tax=Microbacterium helvum TaxID=2773713 RepID=A0ABR8NRQ3_9MICO|nr:hypothetical protein [Microbacterium helvum]MBD3943321.1 hypothetical protein [Microbacterium helvum]
MTHSPLPEPAAQPAVEVDVARSGGIAGITRRWSAQPDETEASEWISLIDRCPWADAGAGASVADEDRDAAPPAPPAHPDDRTPVADGFTWWIRATWTGADAREAELVDDELVGAWRELVDAVRDWNRRGDGSASRGSGLGGR